jgi:regulatory protein SWI5
MLLSPNTHFPARDPINNIQRRQPFPPLQDIPDHLVGINHPGQPQQQNASQHAMQVAQQQRLAQPGSQPHQQQYHPMLHHHQQQQPLAPQQQQQQQQQQHLHHHHQQQSHQNAQMSFGTSSFDSPQASPTHAPSPEQIKDLEQHIQSVYGAYGTVVIQLHHTPSSTPPKPPPLPAPENLDLAPMPPSFGDVTSINLDQTMSGGFSFVENPESPHDYASSYYSPEAISANQSPLTSPHHKTMDSLMEELCTSQPAPQLSFSDSTQFLNSSHSSSTYEAILSSPIHEELQDAPSPSAEQVANAELPLDATIEETGISPEEVQKYISDQDPVTHRWTCLFPECGKDFGRRENIRSHVQTHLGDRQYRCNHCLKCFVRQHDLKRHAKIHTGDKPYRCPCGGGFARQDALTRHRQRGTCEGAFPGAVRKACKRGRPRKKRPDMEDRLDKAKKTRERVSKYVESVSEGSDSEFPSSPADSGDDYEPEEEQLHRAFTQNSNVESNPFRYVATAH